MLDGYSERNFPECKYNAHYFEELTYLSGKKKKLFRHAGLAIMFSLRTQSTKK